MESVPNGDMVSNVGVGYSAFQRTSPPKPPLPPARTKIKAALLGGQAAGKTSVLRRYFCGTFDERRIPTLVCHNL